MILCIVGPTAVGKTKLSIELAKKYNAIIINVDAMQVYKDMNIGTAKVTTEEMAGIKHYLLDFVPVNTNYTVFDYQRDARKVIAENKDRNIIFVGGTGLYLKAALYNYKFSLEENTTNTYDDLSNEELKCLCLKKDNTCDIHVNNRKRLIRFLNRDDCDKEECRPLYDFITIGLTTDRKNLYDKIDKRVDIMIENGLVGEAKKFYDDGIFSKALTTAIGYKELYEYFKGNISLEDAVSLIKKNSRHYAKRQYTWFNNQMNVTWFDTDYNNFNNTCLEVEKFIEENK